MERAWPAWWRRSTARKAGHQVKVLEKFEHIGGDPYIRPAVDVTPMDPERLGRFIGVELKPPYVTPTEEFPIYVYGKPHVVPGWQLYLQSVERGPRSTSIDTLLYEAALAAGAEFEFGVSIDSQGDFAQLPPSTIVATGLHIEPFLALQTALRRRLRLHRQDAPRGPGRASWASSTTTPSTTTTAPT